MKTFFKTISLVFFSFMIIFAQSRDPQVFCGELFILTKDAGTATIVFKAYANSSALWHPSTHNLTTLYRQQTLTITGNSMDCRTNGFDFSGDCTANYDQLGKNRYVISVENSNKDATVTIDANGCNFNGDLYLTYDWDDDKWYKGTSCSAYGTTPISYYEAYYNKSCLELYLTLSNQNGHPYLSWNEYHDSNIIGYNLYKKLTTSSGTITSVIFTTSTNYTDTNFEIDPKFGSDYVEYWVKAKITSSQESLESNHLTTKGESYIQWKKNEESDSETKIISEYSLNQNYPNPFNPSTSITYQLPRKGHVVLKVYNTLGKEVAELVNETKEEGTYSVTFKGDNLPSGMYFYKIQTGEFVEVKKMLLLK